MSDMSRFYEKFMPITETGCWLWIAAPNGAGYGGFSFKGGMRLAHRVSYVLHFGDIPKGMCVCHKCDNPLCVNPDHLWLGTHSENMRDMLNKGRKKKRDTHGDKNSRYDSTIRHFINDDGREFIGTRVQFMQRYNIKHSGDVCRVVNGQRKKVLGWGLL